MKYSLRSLMIVMVATPPFLGGCYWLVKLYPQTLPFVALLLSFVISFLGYVACNWELASIARERARMERQVMMMGQRLEDYSRLPTSPAPAPNPSKP